MTLMVLLHFCSPRQPPRREVGTPLPALAAAKLKQLILLRLVVALPRHPYPRIVQHFVGRRPGEPNPVVPPEQPVHGAGQPRLCIRITRVPAAHALPFAHRLDQPIAAHLGRDTRRTHDRVNRVRLFANRKLQAGKGAAQPRLANERVSKGRVSVGVSVSFRPSRLGRVLNIPDGLPACPTCRRIRDRAPCHCPTPSGSARSSSPPPARSGSPCRARACWSKSCWR